LTASCIHFPVRIHGTAKQCGLCFACVGRRHGRERHLRWAQLVQTPRAA
jgi:hypothetical protein